MQNQLKIGYKLTLNIKPGTVKFLEEDRRKSS
jgi:hypothetical protein